MRRCDVCTDELETELEQLCKKLRQLNGAKNYDRKYLDMEERLYKLYDKFSDAEKKEFLNSFIERVDIYEQEIQWTSVLCGSGDIGVSTFSVLSYISSLSNAILSGIICGILFFLDVPVIRIFNKEPELVQTATA